MRKLKATLVNAVITGGDQIGYRASPHATYVLRVELMTRLAVAVRMIWRLRWLCRFGGGSGFRRREVGPR